MQGPPDRVIANYVAQFEKVNVEKHNGPIEADSQWQSASGEGFLLHMKDNGQYITTLCGDTIKIEFDIEAPKALSEVTVGITFVTGLDNKVVSMSSKVQNVPTVSGHSRFWKVRCDLGRLPINVGTYHAFLYIGNGTHDVARFSNAFSITVQEHDVFGWGNRLPGVEHWGPMYWAPKWEIRHIQ